MRKPITITLDDDVIKKLRQKQAKKIRTSTKSVSLSEIINEELTKTLK